MKTILFIILMLFYNNFLFAQNPEWINYIDPLSPTCIVSDVNNVWIGSYSGLIKFDRQTDRLTFYTKASNGLPGNIIRSLAVDSSKNIWAGTDKDGIGKFDGQNTVVYNMYNSQLPFDTWNNRIEVDHYGNIWIGSYRFLSKFDGSKWKIYEAAPEIVAFHSINDIKFDKNGIVWIGDNRGLSKLENDILYQQFDGFNKETNAIQVDTINNRIWIGTNNDGLYCYDGASWIKYDSSNSLITGNAVYDIKYDSKRNVWFGTNDGLIKYDGLYWQAYNKDNSPLPDNIIEEFDIDDSDNFWISAPGNIIKFDGTSIKSYNIRNSGIVLNRVESIAEDSFSNKWISCYSTLTKFDGINWETFYAGNHNQLDLAFTKLYEDSIKEIWRGSNLLILFRDNQEWIVSEIDNRHKGDVIKEDRDGNIWIVSGKNLQRFDGDKWILYNNKNSTLPANLMARIAFDDKNNLWVSTMPDPGEKGVLIKFDGTNWSTFYTCENIHDWIAGFEIDSSGNMWIGILNRSTVGIEYGGGLKKYDGTKWSNYNINNSGLPGNSVVELCLDDKNNLWIGTYGGGAAKFDGKDKWTTYNKLNSGLPSNNIERITIGRNSNKWFGVQFSGLTVFNENGVVLTDVEKEKPVHLLKELSLYPNYPNPFNPGTTISFNLPEEGKVIIKVFDILGREVAVLINEYMQMGSHNVIWNGKDSYGSEISSGVYFYNIRYKDQSLTKKMMLVR